MSLTDVDKSGVDRGTPQPNQSDTQPIETRMAHGTHSITLKVNDPSGRRLVTKDAQHIANNGVNDIAVFGFLPDGTAGLKTVDPGLGIDVQDATDQQLTFNSNQDVFKIIRKSTVNVSSDGSTTAWATVPHGLSFTPIVQGYLNNANISGITTTGSIPLPAPVQISFVNVGSQTPAIHIQAYIQIISDDTNIYAILLNNTGSPIPALTVTYYLLQESSVANG